MARKKKDASGSGGPGQRIVVTKNGPYIVSGGLPLAKEIILCDRDGFAERWGKGEKYPKQETYALCRCGNSVNKPYCTGTHAETGFDGTETASRKKYLEQAEKTEGPAITLTDAVALCAAARFCDRAGGAWQLTQDCKDAESAKIAVREACNCPSGRLVAWDRKTGNPIEPKLRKSISLIEDPEARASGPIWVKGGVQIKSADGTVYEARNRVTLCRCGQSTNKPFCDGTHVRIGFSDGDKRIKR